jgi:hypothetical protein
MLTGTALLLASNAALAHCVNDPNRSLQDMVAGAQGFFSDVPRSAKELEKLLAIGHPWSNKVPKDFRIDSRRTAFTVGSSVGSSPDYALPSLKLGERNLLASIGRPWSTDQQTAECRVQGPDGRWWFVLRHVGGDLSYVPEDQTRPAKLR